MLLAEAAVQEPSKFHTFDVFMFLVHYSDLGWSGPVVPGTPEEQVRIAFGVVSLLVFLIPVTRW